MTAQSSHTFLIDDFDFEEVATTAGTLFDPVAHGFSPTSPHSGCWRGYKCAYALASDRLVLHSLRICHGTPMSYFADQVWPLPEFNGVAANLNYEPERDRQEFQGKYENVGLPLSYTGAVLVAREFPEDELRYVGYPRPWEFDTVRKLTFDAGRVTEDRDVSSIIKVFASRYVIEGLFWGEQRRNGRRFLARHIGKGFNV